MGLMQSFNEGNGPNAELCRALMREMLDALNPQQRRPQAVHPQRTGFCRQKMRRTGDDEAVGVWRVVGEGRMGGRVWVWGGWGRLEGGGRGEESGRGGGWLRAAGSGAAAVKTRSMCPVWSMCANYWPLHLWP